MNLLLEVLGLACFAYLFVMLIAWAVGSGW